MLVPPCRPSAFSLLASALMLVGMTSAHASDASAQPVPSSSTQCGNYPLPAFPDLTPIAATPGTAQVATPFGEADLPTAPAAALGMYTTDTDILIWLGFPLATQQPIRGINGYETFPCFFPHQSLTGIVPFGNFPEYNFEQILNAEPDFILNGLGYDVAVNERLPQIAPTYSVNAFDGRSWQEHFKETSIALGRLDRYEAWLTIYKARVAEVKQSIDNPGGLVVAPLSFWDNKFRTSCYAGVECTVFRDLGLSIFAPALNDSGNGTEFSTEEIGKLADIDFAFTSAGAGQLGLAKFEETKAEIAKYPLWDQLAFVESEQFIPFDMEMVYGSPSGQLAFLEVVEAALAK